MTWRKRNPPVGSRPGTLAIPPGSPPPRVHVMAYGPGHCVERELKDPRTLRRVLDETPPGPVWVHVEGLGDEAKLRAIGRLFDLHPVTLEDATNVPARTRYENHGDQLVLVARLPGVHEDGRLDVPQVCLVLEKEVLLTFEERRQGFLDPVRARIREDASHIRQLEDLEDRILDRPLSPVLPRLHRVRRDLGVVRRIGRPQREALQALLRGRSPLISEEVRVYLRDTVHHLAQILELVDSSREMATGLSEVHLSHLGQRTNEVMRILTLVGTIFIPLTFIAGVYGMNFRFMPELERPWGYPAALAFMAVVAGALLLYFRHHGWLGRGDEPEAEERKRDAPPRGRTGP